MSACAGICARRLSAVRFAISRPPLVNNESLRARWLTDACTVRSAAFTPGGTCPEAFGMASALAGGPNDSGAPEGKFVGEASKSTSTIPGSLLLAFMSRRLSGSDAGATVGASSSSCAELLGRGSRSGLFGGTTVASCSACCLFLGGGGFPRHLDPCSAWIFAFREADDRLLLLGFGVGSPYWVKHTPPFPAEPLGSGAAVNGDRSLLGCGAALYGGTGCGAALYGDEGGGSLFGLSGRPYGFLPSLPALLRIYSARSRR